MGIEPRIFTRNPSVLRRHFDPLSAWWLGLAPATLEFWVRFLNERNQGKQAHPVLKYRVPHGSQPRHGWAPDPPMLGLDPLTAWWLGQQRWQPLEDGSWGRVVGREGAGRYGEAMFWL